MSRDLEVNGVALETLRTAIDDLESAGLGVALFPLNDTTSTLAELGDRRAALSTRIGETRTALVALKRILERHRETL